MLLVSGLDQCAQSKARYQNIAVALLCFGIWLSVHQSKLNLRKECHCYVLVSGKPVCIRVNLNNSKKGVPLLMFWYLMLGPSVHQSKSK